MPHLVHIEYSDIEKSRLKTEAPPNPNDKRSVFERDRARIIHSAAFRRLQAKTQVYGLGASDYYRTRLTHSLEVAQIGKALALQFGADPDLVEAICLAHDIGHPPFGHAGEKALHEHLLPKDKTANEGFNGNAQNLRLLTHFECKSEDYNGLNLTIATLDGLIKYPWAIGELKANGDRHQKGFYKGDEDLVKSFRHLDEHKKLIPQKTFECQIMNWADDVAYSSHDLEDALAIGTIVTHDLQRNKDRIYRHAQQSYSTEYEGFEIQDPLIEQDVETHIETVIKECIMPGSNMERKRIGAIKTFLVNHISECVTQVSCAEVSNAPAPRYSRKLEIPPALAKKVEIYKAMVFMCVIMTAPVLSLQHAGKRIIVDLYKYFNGWGEWNDKIETQIQLFPPDLRFDASNIMTFVKNDDPIHAQRFARDYVTSLTDRYAETLWKRLYIPGETSLFLARS